MPAPGPGSDIALQGVGNGQVDFVWDAGGNPSFDDSQEYRVTTLLFSALGQWWADPTGTRGSRLYTVKRDTPITGTQLEQYAAEALQKAVNEGWIKNVKPTATRKAAGAYKLVVRYQTPDGVQRSARYDLQT